MSGRLGAHGRVFSTSEESSAWASCSRLDQAGPGSMTNEYIPARTNH